MPGLENRRSMRSIIIAVWFLLIISAPAATPELGKSKLRRLVKLPSMIFPSDWTFDPERGFRVGSHGGDIEAQIIQLRKELENDASDADRYRSLGALYGEINEPARAQSARWRAIQLLRKRSELQPDNAAVLADLGLTLEEAGKSEEAESILRRAVQVGPQEWKGWLALGRFLDQESRRDILERARVPVDVKSVSRQLPGATQLAPDRLALAQKRLEESVACYDSAATNAPNEPEIRVRRALHRTLQSFLMNEIREASGEHKTETEILSGYFSPETIEDLRVASDLRPKDYHLMANLALFEIYGINARSGKRGLGPDSSWTALPDNSQESLRTIITRLENLAQDPDTRVAAGALEILGILQGPVLHESNNALKSLQRSLALDPTREQAWELASGTLARSANYEGLLTLCEERIRTEDNPRAHLLLAKAYEKLKRWEDAEAEVLIVVQKGPNDFLGNLSLAALLLHRAQDPDTLAEAAGWLQRCDKIFNSLTAQQKSRQLVIDFTLIRAIFMALEDQVETARQWVTNVIENDKENELAKEILSAMAY